VAEPQKHAPPPRVIMPNLVVLGQTVRALLRSAWRFWPLSSSRLSRLLKVIGTDTDRSATYDFLLTFHSNHWPISYRFRDKRRFQLKMANFSHPRVISAPLKGFPLDLGTGAGDLKTRMIGATGPRKKFDLLSVFL